MGEGKVRSALHEPCIHRRYALPSRTRQEEPSAHSSTARTRRAQGPTEMRCWRRGRAERVTSQSSNCLRIVDALRTLPVARMRRRGNPCVRYSCRGWARVSRSLSCWSGGASVSRSLSSSHGAAEGGAACRGTLVSLCTEVDKSGADSERLRSSCDDDGPGGNNGCGRPGGNVNACMVEEPDGDSAILSLDLARPCVLGWESGPSIAPCSASPIVVSAGACWRVSCAPRCSCSPSRGSKGGSCLLLPCSCSRRSALSFLLFSFFF